MKPNYRNVARQAVQTARSELAESEGGSLQVAVLQLRMAMEALTYEGAAKYAEELGPEGMKTWQPRQLMRRILEIDPNADTTATFRIGREPSCRVSPDCMTELGTDHALSLAALKEHYDALGSFLHAPTIDQFERGKHRDPERIRTR